MILPITVQGDYLFTEDVLRGVVAQYDAGILPAIAAVLVVIGLLMWTVKYSMDSEKNPHPFKELFISLLLVGVFILPGTSPRFDVQIVPINEPLNAVVVDRVPFIAAVPAWAASSLIGALTRDSQVHFGDIAGTDNTLAQIGMSPFEALVHMHSVDPSGVPTEGDLNSTIDAYIRDCYVLASEMPNITTPTADVIKKTPVTAALWTSLEPNKNNWLTTTNYMTTPASIGVSCREVHTAVASVVGSAMFQGELTKYFNSLGVHLNQTGWLPHVLGDFKTPTPSELMIGRFLASRMNESLGDSQLATAFGRGVFEAQQQRVYQRAGEANMFLQIAIPMITTLETLVFFIAPVMMLLAVMGGVGLAYVGKYLMLLLFTNLWSYIAVFVSALNTRAVTRALQADPGSGLVDAEHVLSYGVIGSTITEIEGSLVVAASMVAAIPMLAMFLLYGGVHSLIGVMGKFGGTYDGKSAAPPIVSTGPNGERIVGDFKDSPMTAGHSQASINSTRDATGVNLSTDKAIGSGQQRTDSLMNSQVSSAGQQVLQSFSQDMAAQNATTRNDGFSNMTQASYQRSLSEAQEAAKKVSEGETLTGQEALAFAAHGGLNFAGFGAQAKWAEEISEAYKRGEEVSTADQQRFAEMWNQMESSDKVNAIATSSAATNSEAFGNTNSASQVYQQARQKQSAYATNTSYGQNSGSGTQLLGNDVIAGTNQAVVDDLNKNLSAKDVERLREAGLDGIFIPNSNEIGLHELRERGGINAMVGHLMNDSDAQTSADMERNMRIASQAYKSLGDYTSGAIGYGAYRASDDFAVAADRIKDIDTPTVFDGEDALTAVDESATLGVGDTIADGRASIEATRAGLDNDYGTARNDFVTGQQNFDDFSNNFRKEISGVRGDMGEPNRLAPIARTLAGQYGGEVPLSRIAGFAAANSNFDADLGAVVNGMGVLAGTVGKGALPMRIDSAVNGNPDAQRQIADAMQATRFLSTDAGREMLNSLPESEREPIIARAANIAYAMQDEGFLNTAESWQGTDSGMVGDNVKGLYDHATQGLDSDDMTARYQAYQGAQFVLNSMRGGKHDPRLHDAFGYDNKEIERGFSARDARNFLAGNADYISTMSFGNERQEAQLQRYVGEAKTRRETEQVFIDADTPPRQQQVDSGVGTPAPQQVNTDVDAPSRQQQVDSGAGTPAPQQVNTDVDAPSRQQQVDSGAGTPAPQQVNTDAGTPPRQQQVDSGAGTPAPQQQVVAGSGADTDVGTPPRQQQVDSGAGTSVPQQVNTDVDAPSRQQQVDSGVGTPAPQQQLVAGSGADTDVDTPLRQQQVDSGAGTPAPQQQLVAGSGADTDVDTPLRQQQVDSGAGTSAPQQVNTDVDAPSRQQQVDSGAGTSAPQQVNTDVDAPSRQQQVDSGAGTPAPQQVNTDVDAPSRQQQVDSGAGTPAPQQVNTDVDAPSRQQQVDSGAGTSVPQQVNTDVDAPSRQQQVDSGVGTPAPQQQLVAGSGADTDVDTPLRQQQVDSGAGTPAPQQQLVAGSGADTDVDTPLRQQQVDSGAGTSAPQQVNTDVDAPSRQQQVDSGAGTSAPQQVNTDVDAPSRQQQVDSGAGTPAPQQVNTDVDAPSRQQQVDSGAGTPAPQQVNTDVDAPSRQQQVDSGAGTSVPQQVNTDVDAPSRQQQVDSGVGTPAPQQQLVAGLGADTDAGTPPRQQQVSEGSAQPSAQSKRPAELSQSDDFKERVRQEAEINRKANAIAANQSRKSSDDGYIPPDYD